MKLHTIQFPNEIGGRYSMWSPISLAAILELEDDFIDFLKGGSEADKKLNSNSSYLEFIKTIVFSDIWHNNFDKKHIRVLLTYSWKLRFFTDYVQQLEMESIGKSANPNLDLKKQGRLFLVVLAPLLNIHTFNYYIKEQHHFVQI